MGMLIRRHRPAPEPDADTRDAPKAPKPSGRSRTQKKADSDGG